MPVSNRMADRDLDTITRNPSGVMFGPSPLPWVGMTYTEPDLNAHPRSVPQFFGMSFRISSNGIFLLISSSARTWATAIIGIASPSEGREGYLLM
jgi:hypothetical protein